MSAMEHERGLARLMPPARRRRWLALIDSGSRRSREKAMALLYHGPMFDERYTTSIASYGDPTRLAEALARRGAPDSCWVLLAADVELDRRELSLVDAAHELIQAEAFVLSCLPGKLAYWQGEDASIQLIGFDPAAGR